MVLVPLSESVRFRMRLAPRFSFSMQFRSPYRRYGVCQTECDETNSPRLIPMGANDAGRPPSLPLDRRIVFPRLPCPILWQTNHPDARGVSSWGERPARLKDVVRDARPTKSYRPRTVTRYVSHFNLWRSPKLRSRAPLRLFVGTRGRVAGGEPLGGQERQVGEVDAAVAVEVRHEFDGAANRGVGPDVFRLVDAGL